MSTLQTTVADLQRKKSPPQLDARLQTAADLVRPGQAVADIGCDHGKLTAVLAASGKFPKVIGADLRPGPLAKAQATMEKAGLTDKVELRLGDGLTVLRSGEVGTAVIAGVSAQTTIDILTAAPWVCQKDGPRLVLVPATKHPVLRAWLYQNGFSLVRDIPVQAAGRWYTVIAAEYTGVTVPQEELTVARCVYGETQSEPNSEAYGAHELAKVKKLRLGLSVEDPVAVQIDALTQVQG